MVCIARGMGEIQAIHSKRGGRKIFAAFFLGVFRGVVNGLQHANASFLTNYVEISLFKSCEIESCVVFGVYGMWMVHFLIIIMIYGMLEEHGNNVMVNGKIFY